MVIYKMIVWILKLPDRIWTKLFNTVIHWYFKDINGYLYHPHSLKGLQYISIGYNTGFGRGVILTAWDEFAGCHYEPSIRIGNITSKNKNCIQQRRFRTLLFSVSH